MKLTEWFSPDTKPMTPGVYQRDYRGEPEMKGVGVAYSRWDGKNWGLFGTSAEEAAIQQAFSVWTYPWRGLAEDPNKAP